MHTGLFATTLVTALITVSAPAWAQQARGSDHGQERREQWQRVDDVFGAMGVKPGAVVADLGAGDGFVTVRLAKAVGEQGKVYAVDISADVLRRLRARVAGDNLSQVAVIEGAADDPKLPEGALDAVLIVNAYHEMTAHQNILAKVKSALKPDGRLVIVEPIADARREKSRDEQTRNHEIAIQFVQQETKEAGFVQVSMQDPFTVRTQGQGHHDQMWMLVVRPGTVASAAADAWKASKTLNWEAPALRITPDAFKRLAPHDVLVLDVRDAQMFRNGHLPGAVLMTIEEIGTPEGIAKLRNETRRIVTYCS